MEVLQVDRVEREHLFLDGRKQDVLYTIFKLNTTERCIYNNFREKHEKLRRLISGSENRAFLAKEKAEGEKELNNLFLKIVSPYLQKQGLRIENCFVTKGVSFQTPDCILFEDNNPFYAAIKFNYQFLTHDKYLYCKSRLSYFSENSIEKKIIYDLLFELAERINARKDGINFPMLSFRGDFVDFASTDFSAHLFNFIKGIILRVGPKKINELSIIKNQYSIACNENQEINKKIFREAYEEKLEKVLMSYELLTALSRVN